jgi:hypothetical protein
MIKLFFKLHFAKKIRNRHVLTKTFRSRRLFSYDGIILGRESDSRRCVVHSTPWNLISH